MNIASYIDHTILKPTTTVAEVERLCGEAKEYKFAAVCVPPYYVLEAKKLLEDTDVKVATVVGFPFGYSTITAKIEELLLAIELGADELDVVHNIAAMKNGDWDYLEKEIAACTEVVHEAGRKIKVIVESGVMNVEELIACCNLYAPLGIDFMKTSTGYAEHGASTEAVKLMRAYLPESIQIKASGGIRDYAFAKELIDAGANRLGCSASLKIVSEQVTVNR